MKEDKPAGSKLATKTSKKPAHPPKESQLVETSWGVPFLRGQHALPGRGLGHRCSVS